MAKLVKGDVVVIPFPFSDLSHVWQGQVLGWSYVTEVVCPSARCEGSTNASRDMIIPDADINGEGACNEEGPMICLPLVKAT